MGLGRHQGTSFGRLPGAGPQTGPGCPWTLASAVTSEDAATVSYTAPADAAALRISDVAGNAAASFSGHLVGNSTPARNEPAEDSDAAPENTLPEGRAAIAGAVQVGETLTADITGIADADGLDNADFTCQ